MLQKPSQNRDTMFKFALFFHLMIASAAFAAGLDFSEDTIEIKAPADAKKVTAEFKFTNASDKAISISKYDAACSCMAVKISDGKLKYKPGESGIIRADFELGNFSGTVDKVVALWVSGDKEESPSHKLKVRVHIPVYVTIEPKTLSWDLNGAAKSQTIDIRMQPDRPIRVLSVKAASDAFTHELKTIEEGKHYQIVIQPVNVDSPGLAVFRIETDAEIPRHQNHQVFAVVRKPPVKP